MQVGEQSLDRRTRLADGVVIADDVAEYEWGENKSRGEYRDGEGSGNVPQEEPPRTRPLRCGSAQRSSGFKPILSPPGVWTKLT